MLLFINITINAWLLGPRGSSQLPRTTHAAVFLLQSLLHSTYGLLFIASNDPYILHSRFPLDARKCPLAMFLHIIINVTPKGGGATACTPQPNPPLSDSWTNLCHEVNHPTLRILLQLLLDFRPCSVRIQNLQMEKTAALNCSLA